MISPENSVLSFSSFDDLRNLEHEWHELYVSSGSASHYLRFEYVQLWYECFALPHHIRIFRIVDKGMVIGFLPLVQRSNKGARVLFSLTNYHCMHSGPLIRRGFEDEFSNGVADLLLQSTSTWDILKCEYIYSFTNHPTVYEKFLAKSELPWHRIDTSTYTINLNDGFEKYYRGLSSNVKNNIRKAKQRSVKAGLLQLVSYQGDDAKAWWPKLLELEDSGWKGKQGSSLKKIGLNYQKYYAGLLDLLVNTQSLRLYFLKLDGTAIAGGIGYVEEGVYHYWKAGFDQKYKTLSPSNQLLLLIIEDITRYSQLSIMHLFSGDCGYKHNLSEEKYQCFEYVCYNNTALGLMAMLAKKFKKRIKQFRIDNSLFG